MWKGKGILNDVIKGNFNLASFSLLALLNGRKDPS